jgi:hypothetical protein
MSSADIEVAKPQINPVVHVIAPLVAYGATTLVRKVLQTGYRQLTGTDAPDTRDPQVKFTRALAWTVITASTSAIVEVAVYRYANKRSQHLD